MTKNEQRYFAKIEWKDRNSYNIGVARSWSPAKNVDEVFLTVVRPTEMRKVTRARTTQELQKQKIGGNESGQKINLSAAGADTIADSDADA